MTKINKKRRARRWAFTLNNPSSEVEDLFAQNPFKGSATHWVVQKESGVAGGTPHLQGFVAWKSAKTFAVTKELLHGAHIEAAKGNNTDNFTYCTKPEGRLSGPWFHGFPRPRELATVLRPWQTLATELVMAPPDKRTIYWLVDDHPDGGAGKTELQHIWHRDFTAQLVNSNGCDANCAIKLAWFGDGSLPESPVIMVNLPRNAQASGQWLVFEGLKDGMFFSGKYKSAMVVLPLVHLVIFANEFPEACTLSADKLKIYHIDHDTFVMSAHPSPSVGFNP